MALWERLLFWSAYWRGRTPWDTNITPPELVRTIEGDGALPPGRALDLGCGTGTNVIYLSRHGWEAIGVDFVRQAIRQATKKARAAGVPARFFTGDVTRLENIDALTGTFDLVLDIGCFHSLKPSSRGRYACGVAQRLRPGATFLLYAWGRSAGQGPQGDVAPEQIEAVFGSHLQLVRLQKGEERGRPSAWYWFKPSLEE